MPARRGEVPFVAIPVGKSHDPREILGLAAELKIPRLHAVGIYGAWQEFVLEVGDAQTGKVKGYTAAHIAAKLDWPGKPARLIAALKNAGLISTHKSTFTYVAWAETITGQYAARKAKDREDWARQKAAQREAARREALGGSNGTTDVQDMSTWTSGGRPPAVHLENAQKERKESGGPPPQPPAQGRGELANARWEWTLNNHQSPVNPQGCKPLLAALSDEEWAVFQWVAGGEPAGAPRSISRKKRALRLDSYRMLHKGAFLVFLPEWRAKLAEDAKPKPAPATLEQRRAEKAAGQEALDKERKAGALRVLIELLNDDEAPVAKKEKFKRLWLEQNPGEVPPWEIDRVPEAVGEGLQPS